ncbi:mitochondrial carrier domain-containing protein [Lanmaoa asiatica]|nr:mitochondrial carrier domain-containing protein [Lanmaoa asiatica]
MVLYSLYLVFQLIQKGRCLLANFQCTRIDSCHIVRITRLIHRNNNPHDSPEAPSFGTLTRALQRCQIRRDQHSDTFRRDTLIYKVRNRNWNVDLDPTVDFVAGTAAVKTRFQNPTIYSKYKSTLDAFSTILREERFMGLYKGIISPLAMCAFMNGLVFSSYKFFMKAQLDDPTLIASPTELIKIRQQNVLSNDPANASAAKVAMTIFKQHGVRGLYRGLTATALRDTGYGTYFLAYEATCRYFKPPSAQPSAADHSSLLSEIDSEASSIPWSALFLAGGLAGIAGWVATFPMDLVKTRMQSADPNPTNLTASKLPADPYRTIVSTVTNSYRAEGPRVFFRGLTPTLIRSVPVNVATFSVYEFVVHMLS